MHNISMPLSYLFLPLPASYLFSMIPVTCAHCGLKILVPPTVKGRQGACLNCGNPVTVPADDAPSGKSAIDFHEGDRIGERYVVKSFIGRGGMGVVYRAEDTLVNEEVALKFLRRGVLRTEKGRRLFLREAQVARRLRHENIVAVHDVGFTNDGILYLSMEYAQGMSLRAFLMRYRRDRRYLPVRQAVRIMVQILDALDYAHRWVVHRDIKPENIMMLRDSQVKVLDFGVAKAVEEDGTPESDKAQSVAHKKVVGTLAYAAPEQVLHQPVDQRTDVYTAGLLLRELLTLHTPRELPPERPVTRADVAPSINAVADKAVRAEKSERWQTARDFRDALQDALDSSYQARIAAESNEVSQQNISTEGMVFFEGGYFRMGNDAVKDESPETDIYVKPFWMDIHPVTVEQYERFLKETGASEPPFWRNPQYNGAEQPVVGVTWEEALAYACWAGKQLPTETQWEFAARGPENRKYPWGNTPPDTTRCNYRNYLGMPSMVTMHEAGQTPDALLDMAGNVFEWTLDAFAPYEQQRSNGDLVRKFPQKTVRGGCFESDDAELVASARSGMFPDVRQNTVGFRCVLVKEV